MGPFEGIFFPLDESLIEGNGGIHGSSNLTDAQRATSSEMVQEAGDRDILQAMQAFAQSLNSIGKAVTGIDSDDLAINVDPDTGRSTWSVRQELIDEVIEAASITQDAEKELMVYQRKLDVDDVPVYGFDYVRGVASTEE
jgi:hypothetical protein